MRKLFLTLAVLWLLMPAALGETLDSALNSALDGLSLQQLRDAYEEALPGNGDFRETLLKLARGETALTGEEILRRLTSRLFSALHGSLWRFMRLLVPAILCGVLEKIRGAFSSAALGENISLACFLLIAGCMAQDVSSHMRLCREAVDSMADLMQKLFPLLLTLLAAVGGTAGAAFFQPAVVAACGTMTGLVSSITLPLSLGAAVTCILDHLSPRVRIGRLTSLFETGAKWTLGLSFTVFISVTALQSLGAAAADGVTLRTAKYAVDNFVPVVGGMIADTMDTLVGASLLIKNALGLTGLLLLLFTAAGPMVQTLSGVFIYRACGALLQPVTDERISVCLHDFSDILMLFFIIQLSVAAMFLLLVAQMLVVGNLTVMMR